MNKIILMGRLTRDPEIRYTPTQAVVANFNIAVDRKYKKDGEPTADFFNCVAFSKQAEFVENYLKQGTKIVISGRLQNNNYTNKDGQKVYSVCIAIEEVEFAESKSSQSQQEKSNNQLQAADGFMNIPQGLEEELPFN